MAAADRQAVWFQMGWTYHDHKHWTNPRIKAMIDAVPKGRMVMLDYVCDEVELYRSTENLFGAPLIWCYLGNFGGNTHIVGPIDKINRRLSAAMNDPGLPNLCGVGATLEALNNRSIYECLFERVWDGPALDLKAWFRDNARSHAGGPDPAVEEAWEILRTKVLVDNAQGTGGHGVSFQLVPCFGDKPRRGWVNATMPYDNAALVDAWAKLLEAGPVARGQDAYRFDLADVTRQALGNAGNLLRARMQDACRRKDAKALGTLAVRFLEMGRDLDAFLGTRSEFLLGKWVSDARSWGKNAAESDYYERDARTILSTWFGRDSGLLDYASRCWNGMLRDYYLPRWEMYLRTLGEDLRTGRSAAREQALDDRMKDFEWSWAQGAGGTFRTQPEGDAFARSRALFEKYADLLRPVK